MQRKQCCDQGAGTQGAGSRAPPLQEAANLVHDHEVDLGEAWGRPVSTCLKDGGLPSTTSCDCTWHC